MLFILTGAIATHILNHDSLTDSIAASIILVLSAIVALATWPGHWREPFAFGRRESVRLPPQARKVGVD
jgi:hypothetical protein